MDYLFDGAERLINLMPTSIDNHVDVTSNGSLTLDNTYTGAAQSFAVAASTSLGVFSAPLYKVGTPTGTLVAKLYDHSGTYGSGGVPTGTALATSDAIGVDHLGTSEPEKTEWVAFDFPLIPSLGIGNYCISVEYSSGTATDYIVWPTVTGGSSHGGNAATYTGSWSSSTDDALFCVSIPTEILDVKDMYSRWKDWVKATDDARNAVAFLSVGGDTVDATAGTSIPAYIYITNGWTIRPKEGDHTVNVTTGILLRDGGGDPFVSTLGAYSVRINYQQPVQAITVATGAPGSSDSNALTLGQFIALK
jgi:hypothetical protein